MIVVFCFEHGERIVFSEIKNIVRFFRSFPADPVPAEIDLTIGEFDLRLHRNFILPAFCQNRRRDKIQFNVFFGHLLFIYNAHKRSSKLHLYIIFHNYRFFNFFPGYASRAFRAIFGICMTASD